MESKILNFFDFDGTLINSPLPDIGKVLWSEVHGIPYPHKGWWGREESLDLVVFNMTPRDIAYTAYLKYSKNPDVYNYILTSRIPKLKEHIKKVLDKNHIVMYDILCAHSTLTKGDRIIEILKQHEEKGETVSEINVWEDRNKEIVTIEPFRQYLESKGIKLNIVKVESDATD